MVQRRFKSRHQFLFFRRMHQQVIGRHAHLPGVRKLCHGNAFSGHRYISVGFYYAGAFATQFQRNRHQVFCRCLVNNFAYSSASGIKNMVKHKAVHHCRYYCCPVAFHKMYVFIIERGFNYFLHHPGSGRRKFGWLKYHAIAGGYSAYHGCKQ